MAASQTQIEEFLAGPLVTWLGTCVKKPDALQVYETFFDGSPLAEVLLQIDPEPTQPVPSYANLQSSTNVTFARTKIFHCIIKNLQNIYEEELNQTIVSLPDCVALGRAPGSEASLHHLRLLLLLLLACAVQGPTKERFIARIKQLPVEAQHDIVECIKRVTDDQQLVLTIDWSEQSPEKLYRHVKALSEERGRMLQQWLGDLAQEGAGGGPASSASEVESNHLAVELADWKARLRKQRQELEEKSELLTECREELEHANNAISKLKTENSDLVLESRRAAAYRDENDALRERLERADRLEHEIARYRDRLADADFHRQRVDELREDNRVLMETRDMLEAQLLRARARAERLLQLESDLLRHQQALEEARNERDAARARNNVLLEENLQLQQVTKAALQETSASGALLETEEVGVADGSLSEELNDNAHARALRLELENKKLVGLIDGLNERVALNESGEKLLVVKCEQFEDGVKRLKQQNEELEELFKNAIHENRKLQETIDGMKLSTDRQLQDVQNERLKITELDKSIDNLTKEKQRLQTLLETTKKRADDAEKTIGQLSKELDATQCQLHDTLATQKVLIGGQDRLLVIEKENVTLQKDVNKLKEALEAKELEVDREVDRSGKQGREIQKLLREIETNFVQIEKLHEFEQKAQELSSKASVCKETIATLEHDLIVEKVNNEKYKNNLEKLGLNLDLLENDLNVILEQILANASIYNLIAAKFSTNCERCKKVELVKNKVENEHNKCKELEDDLLQKLSNFQAANDALQADNAKLQVNGSTLKSQVHSLQSQQMALQLANSQLVAEKDECTKQRQLETSKYDNLLVDQSTLRTLHEQLSIEYEQLKSEQETVKKLNRDLRSEIRLLKATSADQATKVAELEAESASRRVDAKNLSVLRAEHSKLKDDFRNLFTASERLKADHKSGQEELSKVRIESRTLRLGQTEMQGELNLNTDLVVGLQLENAKLQQKCDMLFEMNHSLDADRRALMEHVSQLLGQYHELLTHSLEDKQHYHDEEKVYADKLNHLCRQKEKLEEKIMEHYRKLDNASSKKKGFGAAFVKKVRKAGSDIISKVPSRNRRSWHEDTTQSQLTLTLNASGGESPPDSDNSLDDTPPPKPQLAPFKRATIGGGSLHGCHPRDEVALRRSHRDMVAHRNSIAGEPAYQSRPEPAAAAAAAPESVVSLGSVGSRRTVYLSEDEPAAAAAQPAAPAPPLLVYNRISTVIGGGGVAAAAPEKREEGERKLDAKETAVWYEYGCV